MRATLELIGERGVAAVTSRAVAKAAEISLGSLTYHFPAQEELLRESLLLFVREEAERLTRLSAALAGASLDPEEAADAVEAVVEQHATRAQQIAQHELYLRAARVPELREAAAHSFAAYDEVAASAVRALGLSNAEEVAPILVAVIDGLELRRMATGAPASGLADALRVLLRGARAAG